MELNIYLVVILILLAGSNVVFFILYTRKKKEVKNISEDTYKFAEQEVKILSERYNNRITKLELSNNNYEIFFNYVKDRLQNSRIKMKEVDRMGSFESDDEVGFIFRTLYDISADLAQFFENVDITPLDEEYLNGKIKK